MKSKIAYMFITLLLSVFPTTGAAQYISTDSINPYRISSRSTLHGITTLNNLDTYLSGYNHTGVGYYFNHENLRNAHSGKYQWKYQTLFSAVVGHTKLHSNNQFTLLANHYWSGYHPFNINKNFTLLAGIQLQLAGGVLYIPTNGNNLVSAKLRTALAATGMAIYHIPIARRNCTARYQIDIPLAGIMFSPEYGQSYYEIFGLGQTGDIIKFAHPFNSPSWRHTLSLDIPIHNSTLRIAYIADLYQSNVNSLRTHIYSHAFAIGFTKTIYKIKGNDPIKAYNPLR